MKAVISNRIYLECTEKYTEFLDQELTYVLPSYNPNNIPEVIVNVAHIRPGLVSIPSGRLDLIPDGYEIVDKRIFNPITLPEFGGVLRPSQESVFEEISDTAILNAWPSWGKTFTALAILKKLGQKTLIVTHTIPIRNQWEREIKKVFGIQAGVIGSGRFEISPPIVVGNTQTLYKNISAIKREFGTLVLDEMHHVPAKSFSKIVDTNYARYKIGLTGTLERKDGKHVVFRDYFGQHIIKPTKENYMVPSVDIVKTPIRFADGSKTPWALRVSALANDSEYRHLIAILASTYAAKGHRVLVVSDRVAFLKSCAELVGDKAICITGEIDHTERENLLDLIRYGKKEILFGTQAIFSEGISVNPLSCLILGTPLNNEPLLTQLIGRVIREYPGKLPPKVVDIHLEGNTARRQASQRMGHYIKMGYKIKQVTY